MKKIIFFLISLYLNFACFCVFLKIMSIPVPVGDPPGLSLFEKVFYALWIVVGILLLVSYIFNLVLAIKDFLKGDLLYLKKSMLTMKMGTIPFFILNFLIFVGVLGLVILVSRGLGIILLPIVPVVVTVTYFILLLTSAYSVVFLIRLKRLNMISTPSLVIHIILQLFFCIDIIDTLFLAKTYSKKNFPELLTRST